ncbi:hypothetical protein SADUNF_Sadunf04G0116100 [Salix dunnii]|uniref:CCHC-type domain-containing protein n=1 Tax=Salix dunnii TaxID=1413687 RepID=A0A835KBN6_9ROSI|nr:hypothetical protein SADUNF_Sadunf04G0116100 [Salix dunnii]
MSSDTRSQSRSRSPMDRRIRSDRFSYRGAPYRRESRRGYRVKLCVLMGLEILKFLLLPGCAIVTASYNNLCGVSLFLSGVCLCGRNKDSFMIDVSPIHFLDVLPTALSFLVFCDFATSQSNLCKNCKRPGHYARECPNVAICHNCGLPGHIASECTTKSLCWNCREPGHMASNCPNEGICHTCGKAGHRAKECTAAPMPPGDLRLCNNCYKQGHIAADCTNDKACNNCRKTGHLARECPNEPICNMCNVAGHVARQCPKSNMLGDRGGMRNSGYQDIVCRNCHQYGHMSRDCMGPLMICHNCGGRGHRAIECPSGRMMDRYPQRFYR